MRNERDDTIVLFRIKKHQPCSNRLDPFLEFRISHAEVYSDSPDVSWIETAQIKPVIDEVEEDTYTVP